MRPTATCGSGGWAGCGTGKCQGHQDNERACVGVGRLAGVHLADVLTQHPEGDGCEGPDRLGCRPPGSAGEPCQTDQGHHGDQCDEGGAAAVAESSLGAVMQTCEPARYPVVVADLVSQRGGPALVEEQLQQCAADPQDGPRGGEPGGDGCLSAIGWVVMIGGRPNGQGQDRVEEYGAGGTGDQCGMSVG